METNFERLKYYSSEKLNPEECLRLLKVLNNDLTIESLNSSLADAYLYEIFHKTNGLLTFIRNCTQKKDFKDAIRKALELIYIIVNNLAPKLDKHVLDIQETCRIVVNSCTADSREKVKALEVLEICFEKIDKSVENTEDYENLYDKIYSSVVFKGKSSSTLKEHQFIVLGTFAKKFPYILNREKREKLRTSIIALLNNEMAAPNRSQAIVGLLIGLSRYLESFPFDPDNAEHRKAIDGIYKHILSLVKYPEARVKTVNRAALKFFADNVLLFYSKLLQDIKNWRYRLFNWVKDKSVDDERAGKYAIEQFYFALGKYFEENTDCDKTEVEKFYQHFIKILTTSSSTVLKQLAIKGVRYFKGAFNVYLGQQEFNKISNIVVHNLEKIIVLNEDPTSEEWIFLPNYLQTFSAIVQKENLSLNDLFYLQKASVILIKHFPKLSYSFYDSTVETILFTLYTLKSNEEQCGDIFNNFVEVLTYQGTIWTCSHQHITDADLVDPKDKQKIITVKSYLPLWLRLIDSLTQNTYIRKHQFEYHILKKILNKIVQQLFKNLFTLTDKLNVNMNRKDVDLPETSIESIYKVDKQNDFDIFLNLIDFYEILLDKINYSHLEMNTISLINFMVTHCWKYPLISGFYKLLSFALRISNKVNLFVTTNEDDEKNYCLENLKNFFKKLIKKVVHFKDELLIACLQVFLECPLKIVKNMLLECVPLFVTCFNLGRNHIKLANMTLDTLEHWQQNIKSDLMNEFVAQIIPTLDYYLRSKSLGNLMQTDVTEKRRKTQQLMKKRRIIRNLEPELVLFQKKVLIFLGKQNNRICDEFLMPDQYLNEDNLGSSTFLKVSLPFEDVKVDVYLDAFVPRLCHLALYCTDRKTRVTACEMLHSVVIVFLGKSKPMTQKELNELDDLLKYLAMPLLKLGCDIDKIVQQLFQPLVLQLIHWYTSQRQLRSSHTAIIIETLMEGITDGNDSALRDFSGKCINELVKWSIKQTNDMKTVSNIKAVIRKMRFFSSHPDSNKKLGAALIFNHIYRELREQDDVISIYWFDIVHIFITSLNHIDLDADENLIIQITHAVQHLQRVFVEKVKLFNNCDTNRRIPNDIKGGTLKDLCIWLLNCTGSTSKYCRERSMELFCTLAPLSSVAKGSLNGFILSEFGGKPYWIEIYGNNLHETPTLNAIKSYNDDCSVVFKWFQAFLCSLDGHCFILKNNLAQVEIKSNMSIYQAINHFLTELQTNSIEDVLKIIDTRKWTFTLYDQERFMYLKSNCSLMILKLIILHLDNEFLCKKISPFLNEEFWNFLLSLTFKPEDFHYAFAEDLEEVLKVFYNKLPNKVAKDIIMSLTKSLEKYIKETVEFNFDFNKISVSTLNCSKGILLLQSCSINKFCKQHTDKLEMVLESFFKETDDENLILNDINLNYSRNLLQITLNSQSLEMLLDYFYKPIKINTYDSSYKSLAAFLLDNYEKVILNIFTSDFYAFLDLTLSKYLLDDTISHIISVLNSLLKHKRLYNNYLRDTYHSLLRNWSIFENFFKQNEDNINLSLKFISNVINLNLKEKSSNEVVEIVDYLINLMKNRELHGYENFCEQCFDLLSQLVDENFEDKENLRLAINTMLERLNSLDKDTQLVKFSKIFTKLPIIKNIVLFNCLIENVYNFLENLNEEQISLLKEFILNNKHDFQSQILQELYNYCSKNIPNKNKYKIASEILPPILANCNLNCLEQFYQSHIQLMISNIKESTNESNVVAKIFQLIFIEVSYLRINSLESAKNVLNTIFDAVRTNPVSNNFEIKEMYRLYKCHVYNTSVSIICNCVKIPQFYKKLFERKDDNNKDILWNNIIDVEKNYHFPIEFDSLPKKRTVLVSIRRELRGNTNTQSQTQYLESQRLFSSSLSEDVSKFDFTSTVLRSEDVENDKNYTSQSQLHLDATEINNHPCMGTVCSLIHHIFDENIDILPEDDEEVMELPPWLEAIRNLLLNKETHKNIKCFFMRVIDNLEEIFEKYSKYFLEPLLVFLEEKCAGSEINYFVSDVLTLAAKWSKLRIPATVREQNLAITVLYFLINNTSNERNDIFKYNIELIKLMIESWKSFLPTPFDLILKSLNVDIRSKTIAIGIHLTSIILVNKLNLSNEQIEILFDKLCNVLKSTSRQNYRSSAETLGILLNYLQEENRDIPYAATLSTILKEMNDKDQQVSCLNGVSQNYKNIIDDGHIIRQLDNISWNTSNPIFLQIVSRRCDLLENMSILKIQSWNRVLESDNVEVANTTMDILLKILNKLSTLPNFEETFTAICLNVKETNALRRSRMYDLLIAIYSNQNVHESIKLKCKTILIQGLIDNERHIRDKIYLFWSEFANVPTSLLNRFIFILKNLYSTTTEDEFLGYSAYLLMSILTTTEEFDEIVFEHPLEDCSFEDYRLSTNWRLPNPSVVPLFANTLHSYEDSSVTDESNLSFNQLRSTLSTLNFEPTIQYSSDERSLFVSSFEDNSAIINPNKVVLSTKYKKANRFLKDRAKISKQFAEIEVSKKVVNIQKRVDSAKERERKVTIYRNYRKGDFPDIQIKMSAILMPLQALARHDSEIAKILFTDITKCLINKLEESFLKNISESITNIFKNSKQFNTNLFRTLLDIILINKSKIRLAPEIIANVCEASGLISVGTLILEEYLSDIQDSSAHGSKTPANTSNNPEINYLVKLAGLYKELEEWGMVQTIFLEKMNSNENVKNAIRAEAEKEWREAQDLYRNLIETDISNERRDFYYESYFKCFANLGEWSELPKSIEYVVKEENETVWSSLWDGDWNEQKILPWYMEAELRNTLFTNKYPEQFLTNINEAISSPRKEQHLRNYYSETLCMLNIYVNDLNEANKYLKNYLDNFLDEWQFINPQFYNLRHQRLMKLRNIIDIQQFIRVHEFDRDSRKFNTEFRYLITNWKENANEISHSILLNEVRLLYKWQFINIFQLSFTNNQFKDLLTEFKYELDFGFINNAIELNNFHMARKYVAHYKTSNSFETKLALCNLLVMQAENFDTKSKIDKLLKAIIGLNPIFETTESVSQKLSGYIKIFDILSRITDILNENMDILNEVKPELTQMIPEFRENPNDCVKFGAEKLRTTIEQCEELMNAEQIQKIGEAYLKLANFVKSQLNEKDFMIYILRAMKMNSVEAKQLFACVLQDCDLFKYKDEFINETKEIPTWMFLGWIPQLLANVNGEKVFALYNLLLTIAKTYPQSIMYAYRLSKENFKTPENAEVLNKMADLTKCLDDLLLKDSNVNKFLDALSNVCVPVVYLKFVVTQMINALKKKSLATFEELRQNTLQNLYNIEASNDQDSVKGVLHGRLKSYKSKIEKLTGSDTNKLFVSIKSLHTEILNEIKKSKSESKLLKDYCPWLSYFSANKLNIELEIPGQYDGSKKPLIQHHVKISKFEPHVAVMDSIRKPIKLTILGMDTKEYPFLVKSGEDIRQDQRIQQLFALMNSVFQNDLTCSNKHLNILTYQVIPLTSNVGLIQWIENTESLGSILKKPMSKLCDVEKQDLKMMADYGHFLGHGKGDNIDCYGLAAKRLSRLKVIPFYKKMVYAIPLDVLKRSFWSLSNNTENFIAMRKNFIKSYGVLFIAHWLLGIGDRHLKNSLINTRNGKLLGIDFGYAFGAGTQFLPVPELVPYRLTPHIISLMEPFMDNGFLKEYMVDALTALRANSGPLMATMDVFIKEPSVDWLEQASKFICEDEEEPVDLQWFPNDKINQARRKFNGASSTSIMIEDLEKSHLPKKYVQSYVELVKGVDQFNFRARLEKDDNLSVEEQVDCLIDHATDENLLGRMYAGWEPWY